jgi:hypothetical protein
MVFQSLLSTSISSSFHSSGSIRGGYSQPVGAKDSPPKSTFDLSAWRTFDRVSSNDPSYSKVTMSDVQTVVRRKEAESRGWEKYFIEAERRCTEELCDWQVTLH